VLVGVGDLVEMVVVPGWGVVVLGGAGEWVVGFARAGCGLGEIIGDRCWLSVVATAEWADPDEMPGVRLVQSPPSHGFELMVDPGG
jgi:hypothetical protein